MICLTRMKRILEINLRDRYAIVEPGVVNVWLTRALAGTGFHYAPDPSSQGACTIGGNVATNSGGPHTLKYGVTVNHVRGVELVLPDGEVVQIGGVTEDNPGYDLTGLVVGHEGTFGDRHEGDRQPDPRPGGRSDLPRASSTRRRGDRDRQRDHRRRDRPGGAGDARQPDDPGRRGGVPLRLPDRRRRRAHHRGRRPGGRAGPRGRGDPPRSSRPTAATVRRSIPWRTRKEPEYLAIWKSRKSAFGAIGRLSPTFCTQDGVVPRTKLPHILRRITEIGRQHDLRIANVFHAGDGNIHPILLFDERDPDQVQRVLEASHEILEACIAAGGSVTGEHGIGVEKLEFMPRLFCPEDLAAMAALREVFNPEGRCSPRQDAPRRRRLHRAAPPRPPRLGLNPAARIGLATRREDRERAETTTHSRWRRLPPDRSDPASGSSSIAAAELQRLSLYLPGRVLDQAEALAMPPASSCSRRTANPCSATRSRPSSPRRHLAEVEARRHGRLDAIANDADYLAEWSPAPARTRPRPSHPRPRPRPRPGQGRRRRRPPEDRRGEAEEPVLRHAGHGRARPAHGGLHDALRRGEGIGPEPARELLRALVGLEAKYRDAPRLDRRLAYALHRLAFEGQVLLTDAWPHATADQATVDVPAAGPGGGRPGPLGRGHPLLQHRVRRPGRGPRGRVPFYYVIRTVLDSPCSIRSLT